MSWDLPDGFSSGLVLRLFVFLEVYLFGKSTEVNLHSKFTEVNLCNKFTSILGCLVYLVLQT